MSEIAARELVKLGYRNVSHLFGGMIAWEEDSQVVVQRPAPKVAARF
jgi:rhodanese-related sulfurtransferase